MPAEARGTGLPGDGATGSDEPPYMGAGSRTPVVCRSSQQSAPSLWSTLFKKKSLLSLLFHTLAALRRVHFVDLSEVCGIFDLQGLWFQSLLLSAPPLWLSPFLRCYKSL